GGVGGAIICFVLARYLNAGWIKPETIPKFGDFLVRAERGGWRTVAILRLVPVMPHTPVNYAFGLTSIPFVAYTIGTLVGIAPMTVFYADLGAAGSQAMLGGKGWIIPVAIAVVALGLSLLLPRLRFIRNDKGSSQ
ncbi:MAG TPA: VTT domain-containing protein, partial [Stellaceae bacterium]|nr:VTT domain-containing protein [Stellaceae bacterium]